MHPYFSVLSCKLLQSIWTINFINHHEINRWDLMLMLLAMPMLDHIALSIIDNQGALFSMIASRQLLLCTYLCQYMCTSVHNCLQQQSKAKIS